VIGCTGGNQHMQVIYSHLTI